MTAPGERIILGFDYGRRKIGVAIAQELTGNARELAILPCTGERPDWDAISRLIAEWRPDALVIGVPYHMDGREHEITAAARRFGRQLHGRFGLPVFEVDERLSSREARGHIAEARAAGTRARTRKGDVDRAAARVILQDWLRQQENHRGH